jgi:sterol desaturase/sphingolipid hydroxylase (fatty acid hydroxylase superfamily)
MWYYVIPLAPLTALVAWMLPWPLFILHVAALGFTIWWHLHLHRHYHLNASRWSRFAWFQRKRALHLRHHVHHHGNYAIVEFFWDRVLGTYDRAPLPAPRPAAAAVPPLRS